MYYTVYGYQATLLRQIFPPSVCGCLKIAPRCKKFIWDLYRQSVFSFGVISVRISQTFLRLSVVELVRIVS